MAGSAEIFQVPTELSLPSFHVSSIHYSETSKASAFKDFSVMKALSSFEIAFELLDTNTAFSLRFEV